MPTESRLGSRACLGQTHRNNRQEQGELSLLRFAIAKGVIPSLVLDARFCAARSWLLLLFLIYQNLYQCTTSYYSGGWFKPDYRAAGPMLL